MEQNNRQSVVHGHCTWNRTTDNQWYTSIAHGTEQETISGTRPLHMEQNKRQSVVHGHCTCNRTTISRTRPLHMQQNNRQSVVHGHCQGTNGSLTNILQANRSLANVPLTNRRITDVLWLLARQPTMVKQTTLSFRLGKSCKKRGEGEVPAVREFKSKTLILKDSSVRSILALTNSQSLLWAVQ